jgi:hypothetical protein
MHGISTALLVNLSSKAEVKDGGQLAGSSCQHALSLALSPPPPLGDLAFLEM